LVLAFFRWFPRGHLRVNRSFGFRAHVLLPFFFHLPHIQSVRVFFMIWESSLWLFRSGNFKPPFPFHVLFFFGMTSKSPGSFRWYKLPRRQNPAFIHIYVPGFFCTPRRLPPVLLPSFGGFLLPQLPLLRFGGQTFGRRLLMFE